MEEFLTLSEVRQLLEEEKEERGELSPEQGYALQHAEAFARSTPKKTKRFVKELLSLEFMSPFNAAMIADLLPTHPDEVRAVFAKERFTLGKEDIEQVLNIVAKHL
ncbi:MAG: RNA polymerase Rpb4 family protein [Thermoplasmata archaeon]